MEIEPSALIRLAIFALCSVFFIMVSWQALHNPRCHGFYRFFVFEGIAALVLLNAPHWQRDLLSPHQLLSSVLLLTSVVFVIAGLRGLKKRGGRRGGNRPRENFGFENTANLVSDGLYRYIRHPMYSSLLLLGWGAFLKDITPLGLLLVILVTLLVFIAAKTEEGENIAFFGEAYQRYMKQTRMFIPLVF